MNPIKKLMYFIVSLICLFVFQNFTPLVSNSSSLEILKDAASNKKPIVGLNQNESFANLDLIKTKRLGFRWYRSYARVLDYVQYNKRLASGPVKYADLTHNEKVVLAALNKMKELQQDKDIKLVLSLR